MNYETKTQITGDNSFLDGYIENYNGPLLLYDMDGVRKKLREAKRIEGKYNCKFLFALKANCNRDIIHFFAKEGIGFDVSNQAELDLLHSEIPEYMDDLFISVTGIDISAMTDFSKTNTVFTQSQSEYSWVSTQVDESCTTGIRVSIPPVRVYTSIGQISRFGADPDLLDGLSCQALHFHQAGGKSHAIYADLAKFAARCMDRLKERPRIINLGGGAYWFNNDELAAILETVRQYIPHDIQLVFEFGDFWFIKHGYAIGQVIDRRFIDDGHLNVTLDMSQVCHLRWSAAVKPMDDHLPEGKSTTKINIFGNTCFEGDHIGMYYYPDDYDLTSKFSVGDKIAFKYANIYSASWNIGFNGLAPADVIYHNI